MMNTPNVLLNPGPVNTSRNVKQALLRGDLCHREKEFSDLLIKVRQNLLRAFGIEKDYTAIFITGSGTAALEAALISTLDPRRKVLVVSNGVYGDRIDRIVSFHKFRKALIRVPLGEPFPLDKIDQKLRSDPQIDTVAMVHHETSTGMLNPVHSIARLKGMKGKRIVLDSISGLGGETLRLNGAVQVCTGTANKCIQGLPGISFVLMHKREIARMQTLPSQSLYLDLKEYWKEQASGGIPFTPSVQTFYALDAALEELLHEGVACRIERYKKYSDLLRNGFKKMGLKYFIDPQYHSNTLTALRLPGHLSYEVLHDDLKSHGFVIYAGQGSLKNIIFRVANMGDLRMRDIHRFLGCLKTVLAKHAISSNYRDLPLVTHGSKDERRATRNGRQRV